MEENKLVNSISVQGSISYTQLIKFTSEYLILFRSLGYQQIEVYIHSFILNKGKSLVFENDYFLKYFYSNQVFHLLFRAKELLLYLYRIDSQIQLINKLEFPYFQIIQQNNRGFLFKVGDGISFLSVSKLKPLFQYEHIDTFVVDFINCLLFTQKRYFKNQIIVGQIRNCKMIIRRITNKNREVDLKCQYQNYLFLYCSPNKTLFVLDIAIGKWIGHLDCYFYPQFYYMEVKGGYLFIRVMDGKQYRCKLRKN